MFFFHLSYRLISAEHSIFWLPFTTESNLEKSVSPFKTECYLHISLLQMSFFSFLQLDEFYEPIAYNHLTKPKALRPTKNDRQSIQSQKSRVKWLIFHYCAFQQTFLSYLQVIWFRLLVYLGSSMNKFQGQDVVFDRAA